MIIGSPVYIPKQAIMDISIFYDMPYEQTESYCRNISILNTNEKLKLINGGNIVDIGGDSYIKDNNLYINFPLENSYIKIYIFCGISAEKIPVSNLALIKDRIYLYLEALKEISDIRDVITNKIRDIEQINTKITGIISWSQPDWKQFCKACKKFHILATEKETTIEMIFKVPKVGNETEGYVLYKSIVFVWNKIENEVMNIRYNFKNFSISTEWGIVFMPLHPHIDNKFICFGNRTNDYNTYLLHHKYEYLIDLLNETVRSYNPQSPFSSIETIQDRIKKYERNLPKDKTKLKVLTDLENSRIWFDRLVHAQNYCRTCGTVLNTENRCPTCSATEPNSVLPNVSDLPT